MFEDTSPENYGVTQDLSVDKGSTKNLGERVDDLQRIFTDISPELREFLLSEQYDAQALISMLLGLKPACILDNNADKVKDLPVNLSTQRSWVFDPELVKAKMAEYPNDFPGYVTMVSQGKQDEYISSRIRDLSFSTSALDISRLLAVNLFHPLGIKTPYSAVDTQIGLLLGFPQEAVKSFANGKTKNSAVFNKYGFIFGFSEGSEEVAQFSDYLDQAYQKVYTTIPELKHDNH